VVDSRPLVLIGLPAAGKSTVGQVVASTLDRPFVDLDLAIEAHEAQSVPELFAGRGEEGFRDAESRALARALAGPVPPVVAAGGGAVIAAANRRLLAERATVVWLDVPVPVLAARLTAGPDRPLLDTDPGDRRGRLQQLHRQRLGHYTTSADVILPDGGDRSVDELARAVVSAAVTGPPDRDRLFTVTVDLGGDRSYPVLVGRHALAALPSVIPDGVRRVAIVTQDGIGVDLDPGVEHRVFVVEDGERAKRLEVLGELASGLAQWGLTRRDAVVSVGGGVVSDLAGFLAASYHRGVPVVHVSTTLLGQIDAAIGGKCGVNLPEGKNLLGAFKQPAAVICDTSTLATLPPAEFLSGMGELAKYHFLGGGQLDRLPLAERVAACVEIKAAVVAEDETESGRRAILNYGHTLAHALEAALSYRLRHGEAVAVGLVYAAELACHLGRVDAGRVAEHRRVVAAYGLDPGLPAGADPDELVGLFARDKKAVDGITFVLDGPDGIEPVVVDDLAALRSVMDRIS
jgi:5-deoxy-5-amino-3-dehydroquinate synthase